MSFRMQIDEMRTVVGAHADVAGPLVSSLVAPVGDLGRGEQHVIALLRGLVSTVPDYLEVQQAAAQRVQAARDNMWATDAGQAEAFQTLGRRVP